MVNKCFLNTNTTLKRKLMPTARTLEEEWNQVLRESMGTVTKADETSTGCIWAAGDHYVAVRSRLGCVSKLMSRLFV
jgi:hypothetical protein